MTDTPETQETDTMPYTSVPLDNPTHPICGAKTRKGSPCPNPVVTGRKRCRMHGGTNPGPPIQSGRYSAVLRQSLRDKYQHFLGDANLRDLSCEIAVERALFAEYLSRFQDGVNLTANDISRLMDWASGIARTVERVVRMENQSALTGREVQLLEVTIIRLLAEFLDEPERALFASRLSEALGSQGLLPASQNVIEGQFTTE